MLGKTVKDLSGSLAARVAGVAGLAGIAKPAPATKAEDVGKATTAETTTTATGESSAAGKVAHSPEVDAVIFEVRPNENIDVELLRLQIKAIVVPRAKIGEVRIQADEPVKGRALITVAVQVTDPVDTTLENIEIALQNLQVGNRGGVSSVEREAFTKVVF